MSEPLKIIQLGAGSMGRGWLRTIKANPDTELVGLVDLDLDVAHDSAEESGHGVVPVAQALSDLPVEADAVVNVTIPEAHAVTTGQALDAGLPVLCEKPIAPTVSTALAMTAAAEAAGQLVMISQSRRYFNAFDQLCDFAGRLGEIGTVSCEFFKAPHFGGFRDQMEHPLLVDMAIHTFDAARALLRANPESVYCETHNPGWSWYAGDASANAIFSFDGDTRFAYTGSWCAPGQETSWNGRWRVSAEHGTATWDGDQTPIVDRTDDNAAQPASLDRPEQIAGSLAEFVHCLRTGELPATTAAGNVLSLAMVEAAVQSAAESRRVQIADVITAGYQHVLAQDHARPVTEVLGSWDVLARVGLRDG